MKWVQWNYKRKEESITVNQNHLSVEGLGKTTEETSICGSVKNQPGNETLKSGVRVEVDEDLDGDKMSRLEA